MKTVFLSIIIPAYKEAERIGVTLISLDKYLKNKHYSYEIIVVNDGSPDDLVAVVEGYAATIPHLKIINNEINRGKGHAVKCGMREARGKFRLFMDADNSVSITNLERFLLQIARGSEVVIGSIEIGRKKKDEHNGFLRKFLSKVSKLPVRILATPDICDTQRGFKLFSSRAAEIIFPKQTVNRFAFDIELLVIAAANRLKIKELSVEFDNPVGSTVQLSAYASSFGDLLRISMKKLTGYYTENPVPASGNATAGRIFMSTVIGVFLLSVVIIGVLLIISGIRIQERSITTVPSESALIVSPPNSLSELHSSVLVNPSAWLYSREPMTTSDTGQLLIISLILILFGSDLVAGMVAPRLYAYVKKALLVRVPQPTQSTYHQPLRVIDAGLGSRVVS